MPDLPKSIAKVTGVLLLLGLLVGWFLSARLTDSSFHSAERKTSQSAASVFSKPILTPINSERPSLETYSDSRPEKVTPSAKVHRFALIASEVLRKASPYSSQTSEVVNSLLNAEKDLVDELLPFEGQLATPEIAKALLPRVSEATPDAEELVFRVVGRNAPAEFVEELVAAFADLNTAEPERIRALKAISFSTSPEGERVLLNALSTFESPELANAIGQAFSIAPSTEGLTALIKVLDQIKAAASNDVRLILNRIDPVSSLLPKEGFDSFVRLQNELNPTLVPNEATEN